MKLNLCFTLLYLCGDGSLGAVAGAAIEGVTETQIDTSNMVRIRRKRNACIVFSQ